MGGELRQAAAAAAALSRVKFYELNFSPSSSPAPCFASTTAASVFRSFAHPARPSPVHPPVRPLSERTNVRRRQKTNKSRNSCEREKERLRERKREAAKNRDSESVRAMFAMVNNWWHGDDGGETYWPDSRTHTRTRRLPISLR